MTMTALQPRLILPAHPAIAPGARQTAWLSPDGEIETIASGEAAKRIRPDTLPIVCHAKVAARKLGCAAFPTFDVLELYAFVRPARFVLPTAKGLAQALGLALPGTLESEAECLLATAGALLAELAESGDPLALPIAQAMAISGWPWGEAVIAALGGGDAQTNKNPATGLRIIHRLPEWQERPPEAPPGNLPLKEKETLDRLSALLGTKAEKRQEQKDYTRATTAAFQPREKEHEPRVVLAEAGTGVGKTLGYIAPASVWAEKNAAPVWISTYTRNLQRQLDGELDRLFPDAEEKAAKVVIRKGRENYFCLLNFEEALSRAGISQGSRAGTSLGNSTTALGLMARWALRTRDGDMIGGDFPSWLKDLLGAGLTTDLTDTRGECIYSACNHYSRCFIEHSARRAKAADIVVANHALVMITAALGNGAGPEEGAPTRYIFDEGHHLFDAADGAFSAHLTGRETAELRRWLIGAEEGSRSRSRGLKARIADLIDADDKAKEALDEALKAVHALPAGSWSARLAGGQPQGVAEAFFAVVRGQVYARDGNVDTPYSLETETAPPVEGLSDAALALDKALSRLAKPLGRLIGALTAKLDTEADKLDSNTRNRIEAMARSLDRRGRMQVQAWRQMLDALSNDTPEDFVDWFAVERIDGREFDVGMHRHWVDPTRPFAETVMMPAQGVLITSATLRDCTGDHEADWVAAERRTGAFYVANPPDLTLQPSPFDYPAHTRVLVVGDVARRNPDQVAAAYRELFLASNGGGLGLFTAISRLRAVYERLIGPMDEAGLPLLAQHMDVLDTGTLVDIFRAEENACLLGTDAVRDGVDVPGKSLRLIVFDRVPWPRPDILHRQRRKVFGGRGYDEMLVRMKIKQAYGRLIRRADDRGVFVMLDKALPTRLLGAFPEGVEIKRLGLKEAIAETRNFLAESD